MNHLRDNYRQMTSLVQYWGTIRHFFDGSISFIDVDENTTDPHSSNDRSKSLMEGFWPRTNYGTGYIDPRKDHGTIAAERDSLENLDRELMDEVAARSAIFVGAQNEKEREQFVPSIDIKQDRFVIVRPDDKFEKQAPKCIWLGLARSEVHRQNGHPQKGQFEIQWWRPKVTQKMLKGLGVQAGDEPTHAQRYNDFLNEKTTWEVDPGYDEKKRNGWKKMQLHTLGNRELLKVNCLKRFLSIA